MQYFKKNIVIIVIQKVPHFCWEKSIIGTNLWPIKVVLALGNSWIFDTSFQNQSYEPSSKVQNNNFLWSFSERHRSSLRFGNSLWCTNQRNFMASNWENRKVRKSRSGIEPLKNIRLEILLSRVNKQNFKIRWNEWIWIEEELMVRDVHDVIWTMVVNKRIKIRSH